MEQKTIIISEEAYEALDELKKWIELYRSCKSDYCALRNKRPGEFIGVLRDYEEFEKVVLEVRHSGTLHITKILNADERRYDDRIKYKYTHEYT